MVKSTTISVPVETRDLLNELAAAEGVSASALVTRMAKRERENQLLADMAAGFARLQSDTDAYRDHQADTAAWDAAAADV